MKLEKAKIIKIGELKTFDSGFSLVEWVVETQEQYPQKIQLQSVKEKAENLIKFNKVGDVVDVDFNLRGREWINPQGETKYFNSIDAWRVFKSDSSTSVPENKSTSTPDQDDLPF